MLDAATVNLIVSRMRPFIHTVGLNVQSDHLSYYEGFLKQSGTHYKLEPWPDATSRTNVIIDFPDDKFETKDEMIEDFKKRFKTYLEQVQT